MILLKVAFLPRSSKPMQFSQDDKWHQVVRITGPNHNLLGIELSEREAGFSPTVELLPTGQEQSSYPIAPEDVRREVIGGVSEANAQLGTNYRVARIRYVPSDTPPVDVYYYLAKSLIERLARQDTFVGISTARSIPRPQKVK